MSILARLNNLIPLHDDDYCRRIPASLTTPDRRRMPSASSSVSYREKLMRSAAVNPAGCGESGSGAIGNPGLAGCRQQRVGVDAIAQGQPVEVAAAGGRELNGVAQLSAQNVGNIVVALAIDLAQFERRSPGAGPAPGRRGPAWPRSGSGRRRWRQPRNQQSGRMTSGAACPQPRRRPGDSILEKEPREMTQPPSASPLAPSRMAMGGGGGGP